MSAAAEAQALCNFYRAWPVWLTGLLRVFFGVLLLLLARVAVSNEIVPPVGAGSFAVACSNVAQDFNLAPSDESRHAYWDGSQSHYVNELLSEPNGALQFTLLMPDESGLYPNLRGQNISYVALVCYPTPMENSRPDYAVDTGTRRFVPKMQRGLEKPLWAGDAVRYPVLLYSHGLAGSPLNEGYLETIVRFASYGYVVVAPFHGDPRFAEVSYDGLNDMVIQLLRGGFEQLIELQAVRPHSLRTALDVILSHPDFKDHIDPTRIGGFGTSLGGESLLLLAGAELTVSVIPRLRSAPVMKDPRLVAAVGYVPYFGQRLVPAFGDNQDGLRGMSMPFMAISGSADTTAPPLLTEQGVNLMDGSRYVVIFDGLTHVMRTEDFPDIFTWSLRFFDAHLNRNLAARIDLAAMGQVSGGATDSLHIGYTSQATLDLPAGWSLLGNSDIDPLNVSLIFNDASRVASVWKWIAARKAWAFYTPTLPDGGAAYAVSQGYESLISVNTGEGFWVNTKAVFSTPRSASALIKSAAFQAGNPNALVPGWNLVATGDGSTPSNFNKSIGSTPPDAGVIPINLTSLWAWNNSTTSWYFYAPSMEANSTLSSYITSKGYLDFSTGTLDPTMGFWVNKP